MNSKRHLARLAALAAALGLTGCGGGGSGAAQPEDPAPTGPADPTTVAVVGTITGFGSVFVNGVRYAVTPDTVVAIEGEQEVLGDDSELRLGMKVTIDAEDDDGVRSAGRIEYDDDLRGPIETVTPDPADPSIGTFQVLGVTVTVDAGTVFDDDVGNNDGLPGIDTGDLAVGMIVEVSGFPTDDGFLATRVDRDVDDFGDDPEIGRPDVDDDELELKGFVDAVAMDGSSITVRGTEFLVDGRTLFEDGLLANDDLVGIFVEVEADIVGSDYVAVKVEREDEFDDDRVRNDEFEIEGILQAIDTGSSPNTFTINGITVPIGDASPLAGLVGTRVEIEGSFDADGLFVLDRAEQEEEDNLRTEDLVAAVDLSAGSFTTRLGLIVAPDGGSRVEDDAADDDENLTPGAFVNRLQVGDRVEARAFAAGDGSIDWTQVEREETAAANDDFECELRGAVESITGDAASFSFVIAGVTILTDSVEENNFEGADDQALGRSEFFARLDVGDVVEAESFEGDVYCMESTLDAREVEFEPADD